MRMTDSVKEKPNHYPLFPETGHTHCEALGLTSSSRRGKQQQQPMESQMKRTANQ